MPLQLHTHGGYPSYARSGDPWRDVEWCAYKLVQALKGNPIRGYAWLRTMGGKPVRITAEDPSQAFEIFGEWAGSTLRAIGAGGLIVPVPASGCTARGADPKGVRLAEAAARHAPGWRVDPMLWWERALPKASDGGSRDPDLLIGNLWLSTPVPKEPIVLLDDVVTTGGHLIACARGLTNHGASVTAAICAAQTVESQPADMWSLPPRTIEF